MPTPYNGFDTPVVGADADTWGGKLNTIINSIDTLLSSPANTIKGNNTGTQVATANLTPAQVAAMLPAVAGATQIAAGTKGLVPQPTAGQQDRVLGGDGTWRLGLGRSFGCIITTTNVNGSQPTLSASLNVASISTLTVVGSVAVATLTFTNALPSALYAVIGTAGAGNFSNVGYGGRQTFQVSIYWETAAGNPTEISVCGF